MWAQEAQGSEEMGKRKKKRLLLTPALEKIARMGTPGRKREYKEEIVKEW